MLLNIEIIRLLVFLLIGLASFKLFINSLYNFYLSQIKEYRFDRIKSHFQIPNNKLNLLQQLNILGFSSFKYPQITIRMIFSFSALIVINYYLFFFLLENLYIFFRTQIEVYTLILLTLFLLNLLNFIIIFLITLFFNLLSYPIKQLVIKLAASKLQKNRNKLTIIGITGSYGKTSCKEILAHILGSKYKVLKTPLNWNTNIGVAKTVLAKLNKKHEVFVAEIGAYKKGEIEKVCFWLKPDMAVITGINKQHISLFGSIEAIKQAKFELVKALPENGSAFINTNNKYLQKISLDTVSINFIHYGINTQKYTTNLAGEFQQTNIDGCVKVAKEMNVDNNKINKALKSIPESSYLLQIRVGRNKVKIIDDSYNSNPDGFMAALKILKNRHETQKIVVTPGIIELGKDSKKIHKKINKELLKTADKVFLNKNDFAEYIDAEVITEPQKLKNRLKKYCDADTVILLEGRLYKNVKEFLFKQLRN